MSNFPPFSTLSLFSTRQFIEAQSEEAYKGYLAEKGIKKESILPEIQSKIEEHRKKYIDQAMEILENESGFSEMFDKLERFNRHWHTVMEREFNKTTLQDLFHRNVKGSGRSFLHQTVQQVNRESARLNLSSKYAFFSNCLVVVILNIRFQVVIAGH